MNIVISNKDDRPIYEQITEKFRTLIYQGALPAGSRLPNSGRVRETKRRPEWNPQRGLCPLEENSTFQGILPPERICLFFCLNKSKACFRLNRKDEIL